MREHLDAPPACFVGLWNEDDVSYLFFTEIQDAYVNEQLHRSGCLFKARHQTRYSEWQDAMPADGVTFGKLVFVPDDHPSPPRGALLLDPSVAFGDGSHPTTRACLTFIHDLITETDVKSMLDLGTGTGILSLAAAALGVQDIVAVDLNLLAVQTAEKNVKLNHLGSTIAVREGDARSFVSAAFDLAVANLPFEVLESIAALDRAANIEQWVISGISEAQGEIVAGLFSEKGFCRTRFQKDHPWVSFLMVR
jgi:ribosomal protein L11 methyltransferase